MSASRQVFESITVNRARELILAAVPQPTATITLPLAQSVGFVAAGDIAGGHKTDGLSKRQCYRCGRLGYSRKNQFAGAVDCDRFKNLTRSRHLV